MKPLIIKLRKFTDPTAERDYRRKIEKTIAIANAQGIKPRIIVRAS